MAAIGLTEIQIQQEGAELTGRQWKVVCAQTVWIKGVNICRRLSQPTWWRSERNRRSYKRY